MSDGSPLFVRETGLDFGGFETTQHSGSRSRSGTICARHFEPGASTPWYLHSGNLGGGTMEARRAINSSGGITLCVFPLFGYLH